MDVGTVQLRKFLVDRFSDEELDIFCFDYFPDVQQNFADGLTKGRKVQLLLEHCRRQERLEDLLVNIQRERPQAYRIDFDDPSPPPSPPSFSSPRQRNPRQIFISHANQDATFARRLAQDLKEHGWQVWIAPDSIEPGEKWVEAINRGLEESGAFVLVVTGDAVQSRWVQSETNIAIGLEHQYKVRFIPLQLKSSNVPPVWNAYQRIPFDGRNYHSGFQALLDRLEPGQTFVSTPPTFIERVMTAMHQSPLKTIGIPIVALIIIAILWSTVPLEQDPPTRTPEPLTPFPELVPITADNAPNIVQYDDHLGLGTLHGNIAYSHDGSLLAIASHVGIYVYDSEALHAGYVQYIPTERPVTQIAFSSIQNVLAYEVGYELRLWDTTTNKALAWPENISTPQTVRLVFNANGILGITGWRSVTLWQVETGEKLAEIETTGWTRISFTSDGVFMGVANDDGTIQVWNISNCLSTDENCTLLSQFQLEGEGIKAEKIAFSDEGLLAISSSDQKIHIWNISDCYSMAEECGIFVDNLADEAMTNINDVKFIPDSNQLVSGSTDGRLRVWQQESDNWTYEPSEWLGGAVKTMTFKPNSQIIATGMNFAGIKVLELSSDIHLLESLRAHFAHSSLVVYPDDSKVLLGSWDHIVEQLSLTDGSAKLLDSPTNVASIDLSANGETFVARCACNDTPLALWFSDAVTEPIRLGVGSIQIYSMAFSPNGTQLAVGTNVGNWHIWTSFEDGRSPDINSRQETTSTTRSLAFANGILLVTGHEDGLIRLWHAGNGTLVSASLEGLGEAITSLRFSPDGRWLASGTDSGAIWLWEVADNELITKAGELVQHQQGIRTMVFSPDSSLLVSASNDDTLRVWNVNTLSQRTVLAGHKGDVTGVAFSSDGRFIVSSSWDGTVRVWGVPQTSE